jgi:FdrA protein
MSNPEHSMETDELLQSEVRVINVGLRAFANDLSACKVEVVHVDWSPPAVSDPRIASLLAKLGG